MLVKDPLTGLLLVRERYGGLLADDPACCCEEGSGSGCPCCDCASYSVTLSGITGSVPCNNLNRTYIMGNSVPCVLWSGSAGGVSATLSLETGERCGTYELTIGPDITTATQLKYRLVAADWSCFGCNTMALFSQSGPCLNYPATVEVCCV